MALDFIPEIDLDVILYMQFLPSPECDKVIKPETLFCSVELTQMNSEQYSISSENN